MIRARLIDAALHLRADPKTRIGGTPLVFGGDPRIFGKGPVASLLGASERSVQLAEAWSWLECYIRPVIERGRHPAASEGEREAARRATHAFEALRLWVRTQARQTDESLNSILRARGVSPSTFKRRVAHGIRLIKQGLVDTGQIRPA